MFDNRIFEKIKSIPILYEIALVFLIVFSAFLTFSPHLNYAFPFHVDEWYHIATAKMISYGSQVNWYYGEPFQWSMESGWHLSLSLFQTIFHPNIFAWTYLPVLIHGLSLLSVYLFITKLFSKKEAIISCLIIALLPTNVTIGGPDFLIPVNISLIFIPLALLFSFQLLKIKRIYQYLGLLIINTFLLYAHPPSAVILLCILGFYILLNLLFNNKNKDYIIRLILVTSASIIIALPNYLNELQTMGINSLSFEFGIFLREIPFIIGFVQTIFFIIGFYALTFMKDKKIWSILLSIIFLLLNIVLFTNFNINYFIPYQRIYIPLFLLISFITSYGITLLLKIKPNFKKICTILFFIVIFLTIFEGLNRSDAYYEIIDDTDYENFITIKNISNENDIVLSDPWKARALAPVSERIVYAVVPFGPTDKYLKLTTNAKDFLNNDCRNTSFLIDNNISIVYARGYNCYNPFLIEYSKDIYIFENK